MMSNHGSAKLQTLGFPGRPQEPPTSWPGEEVPEVERHSSICSWAFSMLTGTFQLLASLILT